MKLYFLRHQAAGVLHDAPFMSPPNSTDLAPLLARCETNHGKCHPKSGEVYWAKVICIDTDTNSSCTHSGCHGEPAAEADAKSAGYCPLREGALVPAPKDLHGGPTAAQLDLAISGSGTVKNPE